MGWRPKFSPDGLRIAAINNQDTWILDALTRRLQLVLRGHADGASSVAFSPDSNRVVTAGADRTVRIWDSLSGGELRVIGHEAEVWSACFNPDGTRIVSGSEDATARIWDAESGGVLLVLRGHQSSVYSAVFSPDGTRVLTWSRAEARVWDASTGVCLLVLPGVFSAVFDRVGARILSAFSDRTVRILDARNGRPLAILRGHNRHVGSAAFSPDEARIVLGAEGTWRLWDTLTGREVFVWTEPEHPMGVVSDFWPTAFSSDGTRISAGRMVWDSVSHRHRRLQIVSLHAAQTEADRVVADVLATGAAPASAMHNLRNRISLEPTVGRLAIETLARHGSSPAREANRQIAREHVEALKGKLGLASDVAAAIEMDSALTPEVREEARSLVQHLEDASASTLDERARESLKPWQMALDLAAAERARRLATRAVQRDPVSRTYVHTLGVAQYRCGDYAAARTTILRSMELAKRSDLPGDLAFLAMAEHRLGHPAEAGQHIAKLEEVMQEGEHSDSEQRLLTEARALIRGR